MEFRTLYTKKLRVAEENKEPSRAKQSFKDECDINTILRRYEQSGILPEMRDQARALYADVSAVPDFQGALAAVAAAEAVFEALPARVRERFKNDPEEFVKFAEDPRNGKELVELGLAEAKPVPPPTGVPQKGDTGGAPEASVK